MNESDYMAILDAGVSKLPESAMKQERFTVPEPFVLNEGNKTFIKNFKAIVEKIGRDQKHFLKFIVNEIGTAASIDEQSGRANLTGAFNRGTIAETIDNYVKEFVICRTCGKPDTVIVKEDRQNMIQCHACGARHSVRKI